MLMSGTHTILMTGPHPRRSPSRQPWQRAIHCTLRISIRRCRQTDQPILRRPHPARHSPSTAYRTAGLCAVGTASSSYAASAELGSAWRRRRRPGIGGFGAGDTIAHRAPPSALTERRRKISDRHTGTGDPVCPTVRRPGEAVATSLEPVATYLEFLMPLSRKWASRPVECGCAEGGAPRHGDTGGESLADVHVDTRYRLSRWRNETRSFR
jgi:hypothetical protein